VHATWALRVGLVDELVHLEDLDAALDQLVMQISGGAPTSVRAMKKTVALAVAESRRGRPDPGAADRALEHPIFEGTAAFLSDKSTLLRVIPA
jgi:enoyl-CoA hydratase/carnithine racemase